LTNNAIIEVVDDTDQPTWFVALDCHFRSGCPTYHISKCLWPLYLKIISKFWLFYFD